MENNMSTLIREPAYMAAHAVVRMALEDRTVEAVVVIINTEGTTVAPLGEQDTTACTLDFADFCIDAPVSLEACAEVEVIVREVFAAACDTYPDLRGVELLTCTQCMPVAEV